MVSVTDLADPDLHNEIIEDTKEECSQFGTVIRVLAPRAEDGPHAVKGIGKVLSGAVRIVVNRNADTIVNHKDI